MFYAIYNLGTGEIISAVECDDVQWPETYLKAGQGIVFAPARPSEQMVVNGDVVDRPRLAAYSYTIRADGVDEVAFAIPIGTIIRRRGAIDVAEDEQFVFRTALPKTYTLYIEPPFPYQLQKIEIIAHAGL
jgi:hypothetical protein